MLKKIRYKFGGNVDNFWYKKDSKFFLKISQNI